MKNTAMKKLMQHLPEEYLDEALQYHMTHAEDHSSVRQVKKPEPLRMLRLAAPVSAAACLAAVAGLGVLVTMRQPEPPVQSAANEITELAAPETTAAPAETAANPSAGSQKSSVTVTVTEIAQTEAAAENPETVSPETATETAPLPTIAGRHYDPEIVAQYQPGDINMDGVLTEEDYTLAEQEFQTVVLNGDESILTAEQLALGDIVKDNKLPVSYFNTAFRNRNARAAMVSAVGYFTNIAYGIPETDYPISKADMAIFYCSLRDRSTETGQFSIEKYLPENVAEINPDAVSPETALIYEPQADEESILFPGFGSVPVHAGEWSMFAYTKAQVEHDFQIMYISGDRYIIMNMHKIDDPEQRAENWALYRREPVYEIPESGLKLYFNKSSGEETYPNFNWIEGSYEVGASSSCFPSNDDADSLFDVVRQLAGIRIPE